MSTSQFAVYQLKKKPELRNLLFRTYEELAKDQISVQMENYEQVYLGTMKPYLLGIHVMIGYEEINSRAEILGIDVRRGHITWCPSTFPCE